MNRLILCLVVITVYEMSTARCLYSQVKTAEDSQRYVLALNDQWANAMLQHDIKAYEKLLAEDYYSIDPQGVISNKKNEIKSFIQMGSIFKRFSTADVQVRVFDSTALLTGTLKASLRTDLDGNSRTYRYSAFYVKRSGTWQLVFIQATPINPLLPPAYAAKK